MNNQQLAYHEAGHFVLNCLLRSISFQINIEFQFPYPRSIFINEDAGENQDKGQVEGVGIPITKFHETEVLSLFVKNHIQTSYTFNYPRFFIQNPRIAVAVAFSSIAGYVSELVYGKEELSCFKGADKSAFDSVVSFTSTEIPENRTDPNYQEACYNKFTSMVSDLKNFYEITEIEKAISFVANEILEKVKSPSGKQTIDRQEEIEQIDSEVKRLIDSKVKEFEGIINDQTPLGAKEGTD